MKRFCALSFLAVSLCIVRADGPDDDYIQYYTEIQQADTLNQNGDGKAAAEKYVEAQKGLQKLHTIYPNWNPKVVSYRLNYIEEKLGPLQPFLPKANATTAPVQVPVQNLTPSELQERLKKLGQELQKVTAERDDVKAKLEEALSVSAIDPKDLKKAEEKANALEKERDLLKTSLQSEKEKDQKLSQEVHDQAVKLNKIDGKTVSRLEAERDTLQAKIDSLTRSVAQLQAQPANALERDELKLKIEALTQQLASEKSRADEAQQTADLKVAALKANYENANSRLTSASTGTASSAELDKLRGERDQYKKDLDATMKQLADAEAARDEEALKSRASKAVTGDDNSKKIQADLTAQIEELRGKLQVYEAKPEPFTTEELALFHKSEPKVVNVEHATKTAEPTKEIAPAAASLVADAEHNFAAHRFEDAEHDYKQALKEDANNSHVSANLAATQLAMNHLDDAETTIERAIKADPKDAFALLVQGKIKLAQNKFDDALTALSHAAEINPENAETQNYLGITLSEKGQRQAAEAALRKAVKLDPENGSAHHNLAIVYATQKPPFMELARWHYQKSLELGHPKNPDLEKMISDTKVTENK